MSYGQKLKQEKYKKKQPHGRESWKDAYNQAEGNLEWIMGFMSAQEVIAKIIEIQSRSINETIHPVSKRYLYLRELLEFHKSSKKACSEEITYIKENTKPQDLEQKYQLEG